jgi:hypothetical protein
MATNPQAAPFTPDKNQPPEVRVAEALEFMAVRLAAIERASLVVAAIGALTFLAYKHPRAYESLHRVLQAICGVFLIGMAVWNASNSAVEAAIGPDLAGANAGAIHMAISAMRAPLTWILGGIVVLFYLMFLSSFPMWLLEEEVVPDHETDKRKPPKGS